MTIDKKPEDAPSAATTEEVTDTPSTTPKGVQQTDIPEGDTSGPTGPEVDVERSREELAGAQQDPANEPANGESSNTDPAEGNPESGTIEGDTFPRSVVERLRTEAAGYRTRVRELEQQLHQMQVEGTGALADPSDLPFDPAHLESPEALQAAIDALLAAKPHLKARRFEAGGAAQGPKSGTEAPVDLLAALRSQL